MCCNVMRVRKGSFLKNGSGNRENDFFNSRIVIWVIVPRFENHFTAVRRTGQVLREGAAIKRDFFPFFKKKKNCLPPYVPLRRGGLLMSKPPPPSLSNSLRLRLQVSVVSPKKARKNAVMTKVRLYLLCSRGVLLPSSEHHVPLALRTLHCNYLRAYCSFCIAGKKRPT